MRAKTHPDDNGSERTCIVSGAKGAPETMLRFALAADHAVVPDIRCKLPGREVWTRLNAEAVRRAAERRAFARAFRAPADAPATLAADVDGLLERATLCNRCLSPTKPELVVAGALKVDSAIGNGDVAALIQAGDGASDGAQKRVQALHGAIGSTGTVALINLFSSTQLSLALGKANVVHAALKSGAATSAFFSRAERWAVTAPAKRTRRL